MELEIGQEVICPDGYGRVSEIVHRPASGAGIRVDTYIKNRGCVWDIHNIKLPKGCANCED